jgi:hypothetical protein
MCRAVLILPAAAINSGQEAGSAIRCAWPEQEAVEVAAPRSPGKPT